MAVGRATALDLDPPPVSFDKLLCDEQPDSGPDRHPRREECLEDPR